jgi:hypothetical protein
MKKGKGTSLREVPFLFFCKFNILAVRVIENLFVLSILTVVYNDLATLCLGATWLCSVSLSTGAISLTISLFIKVILLGTSSCVVMTLVIIHHVFHSTFCVTHPLIDAEE